MSPYRLGKQSAALLDWDRLAEVANWGNQFLSSVGVSLCAIGWKLRNTGVRLMSGVAMMAVSVPLRSRDREAPQTPAAMSMACLCLAKTHRHD